MDAFPMLCHSADAGYQAAEIWRTDGCIDADKSGAAADRAVIVFGRARRTFLGGISRNRDVFHYLADWFHLRGPP